LQANHVVWGRPFAGKFFHTVGIEISIYKGEKHGKFEKVFWQKAEKFSQVGQTS
jgi:hypothetical protein